MTHAELTKAIDVLSAEIRILLYSSTKQAAAKVRDLQQQRRDLRDQCEVTPNP